MKRLLEELLFSVSQAHVYHLQTKSYAEHKALGEYYESVRDIIDELAEAYQGKYGIIDYHVTRINQNYINKRDVIVFFSRLIKVTIETRNELSSEDDFLDNIIQEVQTLIYRTMYKINNLH